MKAVLSEPEIVTRHGKPVSVILPIKDYEELLERVEDAQDVAWLKQVSSKSRQYRPLSEYLAGRNPRTATRQRGVATSGAVALSLALLLLCGCASSTTTPISGGKTAPTSVDSIEVLFDPPSRPYKTIGLVTVQTGSIGAKDSVIQREFKSAAAKLGADAVIIESLPAGILNEQAGRGRAILWVK
ncbi:MAG: hypothetical protein RL514_971 [Verrucomicrobiota bacterium]|jgi:hypothetical protein